MEAVRYPGTPPMITALANNELEISNLAYSTLGIAIQNAGLDDLRIIADEFRDGVEGYYSQEYMVLKDGPIQKVAGPQGQGDHDQRAPAARSTSRCGRCCARTGWRTSATTP